MQNLEDEWIEIECPTPSCKWFVRPTSYALMSPEDREKKWAEDVANRNYPASLWLDALDAIDARLRKINAAASL